MKLGKKLKELRLKNHMTQQMVAEKLFVSTHAVSQWERGKRTPDFETLEKLGTLFHTKLLFQETKQAPTLRNPPIWFKQEDENMQTKRLPTHWDYCKEYQWAYSEMKKGEKIDILFLYDEPYYQNSTQGLETFTKPMVKVLDWYHTNIIHMTHSLEDALTVYKEVSPHLVVISGELSFVHQAMNTFFKEDRLVQLIPMMGLESLVNAEYYRRLVIELLSRYHAQRYIDFSNEEEEVIRILTETYVKARNANKYSGEPRVDDADDKTIRFYHVLDDEIRKEAEKMVKFIFDEYKRSEAEGRPFMPHMVKNE